jgi:hypothetical protein
VRADFRKSYFRKYPELLVAIGGAALVLALIAAYHLPEKWQAAAALAEPPRRLTLEALAANGPGDNPHVVVTDFRCADGYVFELRRRGGDRPPTADEPGWGRAWIPLLPRPRAGGPDAAPSASFVVLLETAPTLASGKEFHLLSRRASVQGLVVPLSRRDVPDKALAELAESYPEADLPNCLVLVEYEPRQREDAPLAAHALAAGTGAGLLVGLFLLPLGVVRVIANRRARPDRPPCRPNDRGARR